MLRDVILSCADRKRVPVPTPEWPDADGKLFVQQLSARQALAYLRATHGDGEATDDSAGRLVAAAACDEAGAAVFTEADVAALMERNGVAVARIATAAQRLNWPGKEDGQANP